MSSTFSLYANMLDRPPLRFNYALSTAVSNNSYRGISQYGPYDRDIFQKSELKCAIIYPNNHETGVERFIQNFKDGTGIYPGFRRWFRVIVDEIEKRDLRELSVRAYERSLNEASREDYDIVFAILERTGQSETVYSLVKTILLGNGIPCQVINSDRLSASDYSFQWILANIALSTYAKVGGTPWVIQAGDRPEIVLGMSRAMDKTRKVIVGFTTIFKHNGDFILSYSKSPVTTWEDYEKGIEELVLEAIEEYEKREEAPSSLVFHFHKRTGRREIQAVKNAVDSLDIDVEYALLHLNSYSSYRIFDTSDMTYVPLTGLTTNLSSRQSLLLTDGRSQVSMRPYVGTPSVLEVTMDKESTMHKKEFPRLIKQVYEFSYVNWRGFNARTVPITINYSYLIARIIGQLEDVEKWNSIVTNGKLRDKAWFL